MTETAARHRVVGRVLRAHGVHGAVVVESFTNQADRFAPGARLLVCPDLVQVTVSDASPYKGRLLVRLDEVTDRESAEALRRREVAVAADDVGDPPPGEVWAADLEGLPVVDGAAGGEVLGRVAAVLDNPAHDLLVVADASGREFMIPLVEEFVDAIEPGLDRLVVHPIPGMLPEDEPESGDPESGDPESGDP